MAVHMHLVAASHYCAAEHAGLFGFDGLDMQGNEAILRSASTMRHGTGREKKIPAVYQSP